MLLCFTKQTPIFRMTNKKCHNWVCLKTLFTLQSIRRNEKTMMGQVVCAVNQSVNLSCFKAQTCERSAGPTLLGLQDSVAAIKSAARIRATHLLRAVFLISSHPSLPVNTEALWQCQTFIFGEFSLSYCKTPQNPLTPFDLVALISFLNSTWLINLSWAFRLCMWFEEGLITGQKCRKAVL